MQQPINARSAERDNVNALGKYPFSDYAECGNETCVIPTGAIIDAQIYLPGEKSGAVWVSKIDGDGILHISSEAGGEIGVTQACMSPNTAMPIVDTSYGMTVRRGLVVFGEEDAVTTLRSFGEQEFTSAQTEFALAATSRLYTKCVAGFLLDDGNIVSGHVKIRGENGCDVSTFKDSYYGILFISAIGRTSTTASDVFVSKIEAVSNNNSIVVANHEFADSVTSTRVIDIMMTGASMPYPNDQSWICEVVKRSNGSSPDFSIPANSELKPVTPGKVETVTVVRKTDGVVDGTMTYRKGATLTRILTPPVKPGKRFTGYYAPDNTLYYGVDGRPKYIGTIEESVELTSRWIDAESRACVDFREPVNGYSYGTLHLSAPSLDGFENPIMISGMDIEAAIPTIRPVSEVEDDISSDVAKLVTAPDMPCGGVEISIRGLDRMHMI